MTRSINVALTGSDGRQGLRDRLKAGYQANVRESLGMALEWFPLEEDASQGSQGASRTGHPPRPEPGCRASRRDQRR
jgi:hypothetical protein